MKTNTLVLSALGAAAMATGSASATEVEVSGTISLDYNSHFALYGQDVNSSGANQTDRGGINPALSLNFQVTDALSFQTGFWLDVNDNDDSDFQTQETDIWFGASYASGIATYSATYQSWQYGGGIEEVLDLAVSLDTKFSPSLTYHTRLAGVDGADQFLGSILVLSASHSFDVTEKLSFSIPVSIAAVTDRLNGTESGYAYTSIGLQGSYALSDATSLNFGTTFYTTDGAVAGNTGEAQNEDFLTTNVGVSYSF